MSTTSTKRPWRLISLAILSTLLLGAFDGFSQTATVVIDGNNVYMSPTSKFPLWLTAGQTINIGTNVYAISGIEFTLSISGELTMNSVQNITSLYTVPVNKILKVEGVTFNTAVSGSSNFWLIGGNSSPGNPNLGATDGVSAVNLVAGTAGLNIGTDAAVKTIAIGTSSNPLNINASNINQSIAGTYTLNGIGSSTYNIGAATTGGTISIGGNSQTGAITIGPGSAAQTINIGGSGSTTAIGKNATVAGTLGVAGTATFSDGTYSALFTGGNVGIGNPTPSFKLDLTGSAHFSASVISPAHVVTNGVNANTITLQSGTTSASYTLTLPTAQATASGQVLTNNGSGVLSWAAPGAVASGGGSGSTGGAISTVGGYQVNTFISSGTYTPAATGFVSVLVVGGGGSGGASGGGGGGGVVYKTSVPVTAGVPITVTVGNGGTAVGGGSTFGNNGGNSAFGSIIAFGGGAGGGHANVIYPGTVGGSGGGGGSCASLNPGGGVNGQGNTGGTGYAVTCGPYTSGGGGGAGGPGGNGVSNASGAGGIGMECNIDGNNYYYGGGGGGGSQGGGMAAGGGGLGGGGGGSNYNGGSAGAGGGSARNTGTAGTQSNSTSLCFGGAGGANTGGGGGGMGVTVTSSGAGGSGIVIVSSNPQ